eukprot:TRINITY_DN4697_c0_g1_i1.p2 TRINITY_DN4697_c0_g1~~TRINITY_DN4697_c0_g1_i1.p2  ORF type:complete len:202 (+),score=-6.78 TRINITY_DN4697_c0_g1_i1:1045-1650(+)
MQIVNTYMKFSLHFKNQCLKTTYQHFKIANSQLSQFSNRKLNLFNSNEKDGGQFYDQSSRLQHIINRKLISLYYWNNSLKNNKFHYKLLQNLPKLFQNLQPGIILKTQMPKILSMPEKSIQIRAHPRIVIIVIMTNQQQITNIFQRPQKKQYRQAKKSFVLSVMDLKINCKKASIWLDDQLEGSIFRVSVGGKSSTTGAVF